MFRHRFKISELFLAVLLLAFFLCSCGSAAKKQDRRGVSAELPAGTPVGSQKSHAGLADADKPEIASRMAKIHMPFIANEGQTDGRVKFYAQTFGGTVFVTGNGEIVYSLPKRSEKEKTLKGVALKERLVGASVKKVTGEGQAATRVSYFKGKDRSKWRSNIPTYGLVDLGEVYEGINLKLKAHGNNVEKLFSVKPGARPETIKVWMTGAKALKTNNAGELQVETGVGTVRFTKPLAYQEKVGQRKYVEVAYTVQGDAYGFKVGDYDKDNVLIIDPLLASTFLGEGKNDYGHSITLDASGNVYVAGYTESLDFPTTTGAYNESHINADDVFVSKLDNGLATLIASTFLGGSDKDCGHSITLDASGNVYVAGFTESVDFPTTTGAYNESHNGSDDVFVSRLDSELANLTASTFLGGTNKDYCYSITLDASGNVYVAGFTESVDFPTTAGAYDETHNGGDDVFVSRLDSELAYLAASTFLGGGSKDNCYSMTLCASGNNVYVAGYTESVDFPTTAGAYNESYNGGEDVFISGLDTDLATLTASTFLGGTDKDHGYSITVDASGNVYVAGYTKSLGFPTTPGAYNESYNDGDDAFVSRLDSSLETLTASTFLGGTDKDYVYSIALYASGDVYVAGYTSSVDFPTTTGAYDESYNGDDDVFVSTLDSGLATLTASTFLGGSKNDYGYSITLDASGNVCVGGYTSSVDFPATTGAYDESHNGNSDAFVARLRLYAPTPTVNMSADPESILVGESSTLSWSSTYADTAIIDQDIGEVDVSGSITVSPTETTIYTITVTNLGGTGTATATVTMVNTAPVANAGPDQTVSRGDPVVLDGSGSSDVDVDPLTYQWAFLTVPEGSTATLSDPTLVNPAFVPDLSGTYEVQLIVNDGTVDSLADTVVITADPRTVQVPNVVDAPQADAEASITAADLAVGTVTTAHSPTVPVDHVISQNPEAGVSVDEYSLIDLVVSLGPVLPTVSIAADSETIEFGESATLTWTSTHADTCEIEPGIGTVDPNGSTTVSPTETTTYTITATGLGGTATDTVTLNVNRPPLSVSITSPADAAQFTQEPITVTGTVSRSEATVSVNGIEASVVGNGFMAEDIPLAVGSNTITAQAQDGTEIAEDTITVSFMNIDLAPLQPEITSITQDPQSLKVSGELTVTVVNNGGGDVTAPYRIVLFEDTDNSGAYESESDNLLGETSIASGPGAGGAMDVSVAFVGELLFRDNSIYVFVDRDNDIEETDETNNLLSTRPEGTDVSASLLSFVDTDCPDLVTLIVRIGNSGGDTLNAGVSVAFYDGDPSNGGSLIGTTSSTQSLDPGHYEDVTYQWANPSSGVRDIYVKADDDGAGTGVLDEIDEENNLVFCEMDICAAPPSPGPDGLSGVVMDAVTGAPLSGAAVTLYLEEGGEPGAVVAEYTTAEHGWFVFSSLDPGAYILKASITGYITGERRLALASGETLTNQDIVLSPVLGSEEVRIVLTWGETPEDLEAHLTAPNPQGCRHHCYYWNRDIPDANLDRDDRNSYGPETITITQKASGTYRYYVHDFTNRASRTSQALSLSGAQVKVYFGSGADTLDFTVPAQAGTVWHVFNLDGDNGEVTPINKVTFHDDPGEIDFPVIISSPVTSATWGAPYTYQVEAEDPDLDTLVYTLLEAPEGMSLDPFSGLIQWTPSGDQGGYHDVSLRVTDGRCGEDTQTFSIYVTFMPVVSFSVEPCSGFNPGGNITLSWTTDRAETVVIDQGIGEVSSSGSLTIPSPESPIAYKLTATNGAGETERTVPQKPSISYPYGFFRGYPTTTSPGGTATLSWSVLCANTCTINQGIGEVALSGSQEVTINGTTCFTLTATNGAGSTSSSVTITVEQCDKPEIEFSTASLCAWALGDPVTLTWRSLKCVDFCEIDQGIGQVPFSGSIEVYPDQLTTYTLTATGSGGSTQRSVNVPSPKPFDIISFRASPYELVPGESSTLSWSTQCADFCTIDQGIGDVDTTGTLTVTPAYLPITYTMTATNAAGDSKTRSVTIVRSRPIATFSVSPQIIKRGETATLSWATENATSCTISPDIGEVDLSGSMIVQPDQETKYTLWVEGLGGTIYKSVTLRYVKPTAQIYADPEYIAVGESSTLSWVFSNADTCTIDQGIGEVQLGESISVSPQETTTYTITATGLGGIAKDSVTVTVIYPPSITVQEPDGVNDTADIRFAIQWSDADPDDNATISLYYDIDDSGEDGTLIVSGLKEDPEWGGDKYAWDTTEIPEGSYYIYAVIDDGMNDPVVDYSSGQVIIEHYDIVDNEVKIISSDSAAGDYFGNSVSISGDYAIVGANKVAGSGGSRGSAYIFKREGLTWTEQAELTPSVLTGFEFGYSVSISGDYAIVGIYYYSSGSAYIFKRDGTTWTEQAILTASDASSYYFGCSVSISGDTVVVGAIGDNDGGSYSGSAYIFKREGTTWTEQAKLTASDAAAYDYFGRSVSISGDYAIVGAYYNDDGGSNSGSAYIFKREDTTWTEQAKLTASDATSYDYFGNSVSISGDYAIVGAYGGDGGAYSTGCAYIFKREALTWSEQAKLSASDAAYQAVFGYSVSISGDDVVVGAHSKDDVGYDSGSAYIFKREGSTWTERAKLTASDAAAGDYFGYSVATSSGAVVVGAYGDDDAGSSSGSAYIYLIGSVDITADPEIILLGESSTLSWTSVNVDNLDIDQGIGSVSTSGSVVVSPEQTTTYTILATGPGGPDLDSVTVNVIDPSVPAAVSVSANPETIVVGHPSILSWSSTNADSVSIDNGIGDVPLNGSLAVSPAETTTYTVTATGPGGSSDANVIVTVIHPPSIALVEPDGIGDNANTSFPIQWTDADPDDDATISLYYDNNNYGSDGTLIVSGLSEDPDGEGNDEYRWITAEIPEGSYYVYAVIDDGVNAPVVDYSAGMVRFDHTILDEVKLTASDAALNDQFGNSVSISGDYAIVGAIRDDDAGLDSGSAYIFERQGTTWTEQAKLSAGDAASRDYFGSSVSISGDYAIVGAHGNDDSGSSSGSAYIFKREGTTWTEQAKLTASDAAASDSFGRSVSISGDYAIVGASGDDNGSGSVYIFNREGLTWTEQAKLTASDAAYYDNFGYSVSISGDYAIVGAYRNADAGSTSGSAYIFKREGTTWTEQAKLTASDAAADDYFGFSVSINGDAAIVGAHGDDDGGYTSGSAYIFKREDTTWTEQAKLAASDAAADNRFGWSVSISGDAAVVGAYRNDDDGLDSGSAYVFKREGTTWTEQAKLNANYAQAYDYFGYSVAISGDYTIVGAYGDDDDGLDSGSACVYSISTVNVNMIADPEIILIGESATIWWGSINLDTLSIDQGIGSVPVGGSVIVSPQHTTTYTITGTGPAGIFTNSVTVNVIDPSVPAAVSISANPETIQIRESSTLTWNSTNADSCVIEPAIGAVDLSGLLAVSPTETTTYTITASGPGGTDTAGVTVTVTYPVPTVSIGANPETIPLGGSATLSWTSTDADTCTIDHGIGSVELSGSMAVSPSETTTYTITATGPGGSSEANVMVTVNYPPSITMVEPDGIEDNANTYFTIQWTDADPDDDATVSLYYDINNYGSDGTLIVSGLSEDPDGEGNDEYRWITSDIPEGSYYIYAVIDDGVNNPVVDYSDGMVRFDHTILDEVKLTASDAAAQDYFGYSVSISGDYAIVGAYYDDDAGYNAGSAYIFKREGTNWTEQAKLTASDAAVFDLFGYSVSISGDYAIVSARNDDIIWIDSGSAYIFKREGTTWTEQAKLTASDSAASDYFGNSVSISGDYAIVGALGDDNSGSNSGSAYVFKREGTTWTEQAKLTASDAAAGDYFGNSVSISGDYAIVGAYLDDDVRSDMGSAYIFKREGTTWTEQAKLTASEAASRFGVSVSISGDTVVVGALGYWSPSSAYIFKREDTTWTEQAKLTASDSAGNYFGFSVSISGDYAIIGAIYDDDDGASSGAAYIFKREGTTWSEQAKVNANYAEDYDYFGYSVAISGDYTIVGATHDDDDGLDSGSAHIYSIPTVNVNVVAEPETILIGESCTLSWTSVNVDTLSIDQGIGSVSAVGSVVVSPEQTTTYTITATGPAGTFTDSVTVNVIDPSVPATVSITANPETIEVGESTTLTWGSTNAHSCVIEPDIGSVDYRGSMVVSPAGTTTYTITATGPGGTATAAVTVTVTSAAPTVSISAIPASIDVGETATLAWTSTNADSVSIDQGIGVVALNGSTTVSPTETTTYTITATGPGGTATDSVTVTVLIPPTVSISADPETIQVGGLSTLSWSSTNADSVSIDQGIGIVALNGSMAVSPIETTTYTITASGPGGTATASVTVEISPIAISITSPLDGETTSESHTLVQGTITNATGNETGVTVNGIIAMVFGNQFAANDVPMAEGENTITATATDKDGNTITTSITNTLTTSDYIRITGDIESSVSPHETTLRIDGSFSFTESSLTYTGPGVVEFLESTSEQYRVRMTTEGIYYFTAEVTDSESIAHTDTIAIEVLDGIALDTLLKAKWNGMKTALSTGDIESALSYFAEGTPRDMFSFNFSLMSSYLPEIVAGMGPITLVQVEDNLAEYEMIATQDGTEYSFYVEFVKDGYGLWKLTFF